jgi:DNA-binding CsgD family transcriptional regulator
MGDYDFVGYRSWCTADLATALAWSGTPGDDPPAAALPAHTAFLAPWILCSRAAHDRCRDRLAAADAHAAEAARRARAGGQRLAEAIATHQRLLLRPAKTTAYETVALATGLQGSFAAALAAGAAALGADDGDALVAAAEQWRTLGFLPLAAEYFDRAAAVHTAQGLHAAATRARSAGNQVADAMEAPLPWLRTSDLPALTPREREVARLAADGLTNADIAARLGVSVRTVHTHLQSAYAKLGVNDRTRLGTLLA